MEAAKTKIGGKTWAKCLFVSSKVQSGPQPRRKVVKQETANEQWFSDIVLPWKHYVPTDEFLGDIIEQIQWALEHPQEAKQMTHDAFDLVYEHILPMHIDAYIIRALQKYSALLR